jgi:hypothetical protein
MEFNNLDDIIADLKANYTGPSQNYQESGDKPPKKVLGQPMGMGVSSVLSAPTRTAEGTQIFRPVDYSVSPNAIYDRLRDGSYVAKFENYLGETGNEDRLAREQSATEQWMNGLGKFTTKTLNYALDSTVGTVWGIFEGMASGEFRDVWDNDFSNWMDDVNKKLDYALPNYYTDEQKSQGVLSSMLTTNFWANDFLGGLAFVTGALLPEAAIALASGGASVPVSMAKAAFRGTTSLGKAAFKAGTKKAVKETVENLGKQGAKNIDDVAKFNRIEQGTNSVRNLQNAIYAKKTGDVLNTGRFLVQSSNFEAGMEARHNFHDAIDSYIENYKESNGRDPSPEDLSQFINDATKAANYVYTANMAILSVSNAAMFGKTFGIAPGLSKRITNAGNRLIGLGMKRGADGTMALQKANRLQKVAGNTYKVLSKPAVEGLYEEGLQGVAGSTMQNYLDAKYNPESENALSVWSSFTDALNHQYTSNEGWKEMAIGMLIGFGAPMLQGQAPSGIMSDSYRSRRKNLESQVELSNKQRSNIITRVNDATAISNFSAKMKSKADNMEDVSVDNSLVNGQYIKASENVRSQRQTLKDYDAIVDNMEFTEDQITEIGQENVDAYKQSLKDGFRKDLENYNFAKKATEALGLDRTLKDTPANIAEMGDAVMMNIMMGKSALDRARTVASQIDSMIGTEGVFNHLEHYSNLSQEQKDKIELLKKKKRQLNTALKQADKYGKELAGISTGMKRDFTDETKQKRFDKATEKRVAVQQEVNTLNQEIEELEQEVNNDLASQNFDLSQTLQTDETTHDVASMVEELDKLEGYAKSLQKAGKTESYETLMNMVEEFKTQSDAHREMNNMVRKMYDTNFFTTKEGRGLRKMITGKKYELSEEFRQIIRDNDKVIDESLNLAGFRNTGKTAEQLIEEVMGDNNETLSDREKYRLESIIRVQLGYAKLQQKLDKIVKDQKIIDPEPITDKKTPLKGDTVALTQKLEPEGKDLGSVEVLTDLINSITAELDQFRLGRVDQKRIDQLEQKLEELTQQKQKLEEGKAKPKPQAETEETQKTDVENIQNIQDPEARKAAEIAFIMSNLFAGVGEASANKIKEYADRIISGKQTREQVIQGLSKSFVEGIDALLDAENKAKSETKEAIFSDETEAETKKFIQDKNTEKLSIEELVKRDPDVTKLDRVILKALSKFLKGKAIYYQNGYKFGVDNDLVADKGGYGATITSDGDILIFNEGNLNVETLIHEALHTLVFTKINDTARNEKDQEFVDELQRIFDLAKQDSDLVSRYEYAFNNLDEFVSEAFGNKNFRQELAYVKDNSGNKTNIFKDFLDALRKFLKSEYDFDLTNNALESIFSAVEYTLSAKPKTTATADTSELEKLNSEIASTKEALKQAKNTRTVRIVQTEDYKRVEELNKKKVKEGLTEEEQSELDNLEDDIDQWITINGIVVEGLRLSDLLRQRAVLKNAPVTELQPVQTITAQDVLDSPDIKDKTNNIYANLGQSYHAVTATMSKMEDGTPAVEISGVNAESLIEEVGFPFEYETNAQNNVLITQETQRQINETSPISILPTNKNLDTNYSIVLKTVTDTNGNQEVMPLLSQFKTSFNEEQIPEEIYNMSTDENVFLEVDPKDAKNIELLETYKNARTEKGKERALNELKRLLVIKVKDSNGNFVAVLKAKRSKGNIDSNYTALSGLRNKVIANEEVLLDLVEERVVPHNKLELGDIKVKNILPGHPNFNFSKDEDGQISIDSKSLTEQDIEKIDDIGYMQNGEIKVRKKGREIDTRFLSKVQKDKSGTKFPFAVFSVGNKLIAYPLSITPGKVSQEDMQEFERIFKSRTNIVDKANALNIFMAQRGIDIKQSGNAFVAIGKDNMNDEFFSKKVAQLESIEYFRNLDEEWLDNKTPLTEVLGTGVSIDIKTSDPFHSPKLEMDFSNLDIEVTIQEETKPQADVSKTVGKGASKIANHIKNSKKKDC